MKQSANISFTVMRSLGNQVGKNIEPDGKSGIIKGAQQPFVVGYAYRHIIDFPDAVPIIDGLNPNSILMPGVHNQPKVGVVTKKLLDSTDQKLLDKLKKEKGLSIVSRTKDHFSYPKGGGMVNLDNDTGMGGKAFDEALCKVIPGYKDCYRILYPSSSSCIYDASGNQLTGDENLHIHTGILDMSDIDRFKKALQVHLWLAGYGEIKISRNGDMLVRSIVDDNAIGPVQPVFAGGAICQHGLVQKRPTPVLKGTRLLDTTKLKDPTTDELVRYRGMVSAAKEAKNKEADDTFLQWKKDKAAEYRMLGHGDKEINTMLSLASKPERGTYPILSGSFVVETDDHGPLTIGELLTGGDKYNEDTLADPLEPKEGSGKAKFFVNDISFYKEGKPVISSMLHGGRNFLLRHDYKSLEDAFTKLLGGSDADQVILREHWADWMVAAEVDEIKAESLLHLLKLSGGKGISSIGALRKVYGDKKKRYEAREKARIKAEATRKINRSADRESEAIDPENLKKYVVLESGALNQNVTAQVLQGTHRGSTFYRQDNGSMLAYNEKTGLWVPYNGDAHVGWVQDELRKLVGVTSKFTAADAKSISEMIRRDEVLANVRACDGGIDYRQKILDAHRQWVHFNNGLWNIKEKKFYPGYRKDIMLTYGMGCNYVKGTGCDRYKSFLMETYGVNSENAFVIQKRRACNQAIIRRMVDLHILIGSFGETRTGKGTQRDIENKLAGGEINVGATTRKRVETNRFEFWGLADKSLISFSDESSRPMRFDLMKPLTSGDPMPKEAKNVQQYGEGARMSGICRMDSNGMIWFIDDSLAPYSRLVPFFHDTMVPPEKRTLRLADQIIEEELCGIVLWSLGIDEQRVRELTVGSAMYKDPDKVRYLFSTQPEAKWLRECVVYKQGARLPVGGKRSSSHLTAWKSYQDFRNEGVRDDTIAIFGQVDNFKRMVRNICRDFFRLNVELENDPGNGKYHKGRGWYFKNLTLRNAGVVAWDLYDMAKVKIYLEALGIECVERVECIEDLL